VERRIEQIFEGGRAAGRVHLAPFVCGGHPGTGMLGVILRGLERGGAALAEVGFPYSDPIADGPTIAAAMHEALSRGTTVASVMEEVRVARA
jgi:tryptophan synthase alpha chain